MARNHHAGAPCFRCPHCDMPISLKFCMTIPAREVEVDDVMACCEYCERAFSHREWRIMHPYEPYRGRLYAVRLPRSSA